MMAIFSQLINFDTAKLYCVSQDVNNGYDTYDAFVICADNPEEARDLSFVPEYSEWVKPSEKHLIRVEYLGIADPKVKKGIVLGSFNRG